MYKASEVEPIVRSALLEIGETNPIWVKFAMMIMAHESGQGRYIRQLRGGPARGLGQMEPATHDDIVKWLKARNHRFVKHANKYFSGFDSNKLYDIRYSVMMLRAFFLRLPEKFYTDVAEYNEWRKTLNPKFLGDCGEPPTSVTEMLSEYAEIRWNTYLGAAHADSYHQDLVKWEAMG